MQRRGREKAYIGRADRGGRKEGDHSRQLQSSLAGGTDGELQFEKKGGGPNGPN